MTDKPQESGPLMETQAVLASHWRVPVLQDREENLNREMLLEALEERIFHLLGHNMDKLLSSMYLLDVSEARFQTAMATEDMRSRARAIALIVYDRETEKIALRRKYAGPTYGRIEESPDT